MDKFFCWDQGDDNENNSDNGDSTSDDPMTSLSEDEYECVCSSTVNNGNESAQAIGSLEIQDNRFPSDTPIQVLIFDQVDTNDRIVRPYNLPAGGIAVVYIPVDMINYRPQVIILNPDASSGIDLSEIETPSEATPFRLTESFDVENGLLPESALLINSDEDPSAGPLYCVPKTCSQDVMESIILIEMDVDVENITGEDSNMTTSVHELVQENSESNLYHAIEHQFYVSLDDVSQQPSGSNDGEPNNRDLEHVQSENNLHQPIITPENTVSPSIFRGRLSSGDGRSNISPYRRNQNVLNVDATPRARPLASADPRSINRRPMIRRRLFHNNN